MPPKTRRPAHVLGRLGRNPPLALGDRDHADHHRDEQPEQEQDRDDAVLAGLGRQLRRRVLPQSLHGHRHPRQDARHDQEADAVADAVFVDLLADPHQENRAGRHDADADHAVPEVAVVGQDDVHLRAHHVLHPERALDGAEDDGGVSGVFVDPFSAALAFLHHRFERGDDAGQELEDDRGRDVGHDPEAEDRAHADRGAAEHRHGAEELAGACCRLSVPPSSSTGPG